MSLILGKGAPKIGRETDFGGCPTLFTGRLSEDTMDGSQDLDVEVKSHKGVDCNTWSQ